MVSVSRGRTRSRPCDEIAGPDDGSRQEAASTIKERINEHCRRIVGRQFNTRFGVPGSGFRVRVPGSGFRFRVPGSGSGFRFRVPGSGFRFGVPVPSSGSEF